MSQEGVGWDVLLSSAWVHPPKALYRLLNIVVLQMRWLKRNVCQDSQNGLKICLRICLLLSMQQTGLVSVEINDTCVD
jgi:hypothetical protein